MVDWVRMAQNVLRYNVVIVGSSSTRGAGSPRLGERNTEKSLRMRENDHKREFQRSMKEEDSCN